MRATAVDGRARSPHPPLRPRMMRIAAAPAAFVRSTHAPAARWHRDRDAGDPVARLAAPAPVARTVARVLVVEEHDDVAAVVSLTLRHAGFDVTWVRDGRDARHAIDQAAPDLLILDLELPRFGGLVLLGGLRARGFDRPVLILSALDEHHVKIEAFHVGADDYVTKPFHTQELVARVRALLRRCPPAPVAPPPAPPPATTPRLALAGTVVPPDEIVARFGLTPREADVARLIAAGLSNPEIAATLRISRFTARNHVQRILAKLGVVSRGRAAALLLEG